MSSLFVSEEAEHEGKVKLEAEVEMDVDADENTGIRVKQEPGEDTNDTDGVQEPNDVGMRYYEDSDSDSDSDFDDPIVDTIPVHLNVSLNDTNTEGETPPLAPLLLQFPTKSKQSHLTQNHISELHRLEIKAESGVVELRLPLNNENFFSGRVSEKYNVSEQYLRGVIIHDEPIGKPSEGNLPAVSVITTKEKANAQDEKKGRPQSSSAKAGNINPLSSIRAQPGAVGGSRYLVGVQDNEGHLHLTPISDTCMLRPHFTYIDNVKTNKLERERELQRELNDTTSGSSGNKANDKDGEDAKKKNVSVVTMSAKSTKENIPRLGGALLSAKLETEEQGQLYQIVPSNEAFVNSQFTENSGNVLHSRLSQHEYLDLLLEQTKL